MIKTLQLNNPTRTPGWYHDEYLNRDIYWDGYKWYLYSAGVYVPLGGRWEPAPKTVNVTAGDSLRILMSFYYSGPAFSGHLYGAIGNKAGIYPYYFDEILYARVVLALPEHATPHLFLDKNVDIPITTALAGGHSYAIYAKVEEGGADVDVDMSVYLEDAVAVAGADILFSDFTIIDFNKV